MLPTVTAGTLHPHQRAGTPASWREEIRGNQHQNKNPAKGSISSIPLSDEHSWSTRRKKTQNPNYRGIRD
jgi:hypothetical protein